MIAFTPEQIKEIAEQLDCGLQVYYHKRTGELLFILDHDEYDFEDSPWNEAIDN